MNKLDECVDAIVPACCEARMKYDIRLVLAALAAQFAVTAQAALAGGINKRFVAEIIAGALETAYTPLEKKPVVHYIDGNENLGRKQ
jgi:hypothetical protein